MCGPDERWWARADAIVAVAGTHVLDASVPPLLTSWVSKVLDSFHSCPIPRSPGWAVPLRAWQMTSKRHNGDVVVSPVGTESLRAPKT